MYEIIGYERLDYTNKNGKHILGYRVAFTYDLQEGVGVGKACDSVFIDDIGFNASGISVGSPAMPIYNKYGRCTGFVESPM